MTYIEDISARPRTIIKKPKKLQMTVTHRQYSPQIHLIRDRPTHDNGSTCTSSCDCKRAIGRDENESHHHSETEAGYRNEVKIPLDQRLVEEDHLLPNAIIHTLNSCFLPIRRMSAESAGCILPNAELRSSPSLLGLDKPQPLFFA